MPETYTCKRCSKQCDSLFVGECEDCYEEVMAIAVRHHIDLPEARDIRTITSQKDASSSEPPPSEQPPSEPNGEQPEDTQPPFSKFTNFFRLLGYAGKHYVFHVKTTGQVMMFTGPDLMRKGNLYTIAPEPFWKQSFGDNWTPDHAMNALIRLSETIGFYDPSIIRGRGAWEDKGRSVLHLGNKLIVDGQPQEISEFDTEYIYEHRASMHVKTVPPLKNDESCKLIDICSLIRWDDLLYGQLLAGWIFSAIICGALQWRSHIYIHGTKGSGKTWVMDHVVKQCLGGIALGLQSKTTEAGIRQAIAGDARPVVFDESEAEGMMDRQRMQRVFDLARQASSESAPPIIKGSANGQGAIEYVVRSCFAFSSINVSIQQQADESRTTLLKMAPTFKEMDHSFKSLEEAVFGIITDEYRDGLIARAVRLAPTIRHNHKVLAEAGQRFFGGRRQSDQLSMMLAGFWGLRTTTRFKDHEEARAFIQQFNWSAVVEDVPRDAEQVLVDTILQSIIPMKAGAEKLTLGELLHREANDATINSNDPDAKVVRRYGLMVKNGSLYIANQCNELSKLLNDTPWKGNWSKALLNLQGAKKSQHAEYFMPGMTTRAVIIPMPQSIVPAAQQQQIPIEDPEEDMPF